MSDHVGRVRMLVASALGLGYAPIAPGTVGSLLGLPVAWILWRTAGGFALPVAALITFAAGVWAAEGIARWRGHSDPSEVVVDEVAGQMVALLFLVPTPRTLLAAFLLFRFFDIVKPFPAGRAESLPGGFGIMVDDLIAGAYANVALRILSYGFPALVGGR